MSPSVISSGLGPNCSDQLPDGELLDGELERSVLVGDGFAVLVLGLAVVPAIGGCGDELPDWVMRNIPNAKTQTAVTETTILMRLQPERRRTRAWPGTTGLVRRSSFLARLSAVYAYQKLPHPARPPKTVNIRPISATYVLYPLRIGAEHLGRCSGSPDNLPIPVACTTRTGPGSPITPTSGLCRRRHNIHRARNVLAKVPAGMQAEVKDAYWKLFDTRDLKTQHEPRLVELAGHRITEMADATR